MSALVVSGGTSAHTLDYNIWSWIVQAEDMGCQAVDCRHKTFFIVRLAM